MDDDVPAGEFDALDFDAKELVQRYRKRIPLPSLQKNLKQLYAGARQELVGLINEKYADFVSLSSRMQGVEQALKPLRAPLEESAQLTHGLKQKLGEILQQADEAQQALTRSQMRRHALDIYIKNAKLLAKVRDTLECSNLQGSSLVRDEDALSREYVVQESIARDLRRIRLELGGSELVAEVAGQTQPVRKSFVEGGNVHEQPVEWKSLLREAADVEDSFAKSLSDRLRIFLSEAVASASAWPPPRIIVAVVSHLCQSLVMLGRAEGVYNAFVDVFVKSTLDAAANLCGAAGGALAAGGASGSSPLGAVDLRPFFAHIRTALFSEAAPLLWFARRLRPQISGQAAVEIEDEDSVSESLTVPRLQLVACAGVVPVLRYLEGHFPNVFMPAFPAVFAANHGHAARFLLDIEGLMASEEQRSFRSSAAAKDFQKRWKTQVYAQLRSKEASQRLEAAAAAATAAPTALTRRRLSNGCELWLDVSVELVNVLQTVWSDTWYLDALFPKVVQLTLELLARYSRLLRAAATDGATAGDAAWHSGGVGTPAAWTSQSAVVRSLRAAADLLQILEAFACAPAPEDGGSIVGSPQLSAVDGPLALLVLSRAPAGSASRLARELLLDTATELRPLLESTFQDAVAKQLGAAVAPQFEAIRSIPAFYRMLDKPLPTKASPYVDSALRPIFALQTQAAEATLSGHIAASWLRRVLNEAAMEFAAQAAQLLESTRQQEASLRRLANRGGANADSRVSDLDKIQVQLCLDVETFTTSAHAIVAKADDSAGQLTSTNEEGLQGLTKLAEAVATVWHTYRQHRPEPVK